MNNGKVLRVYQYILEYKRCNDGNSPTIEDIKKVCSISSKSQVVVILEKMEDRGLIHRYGPKGGKRILVVGGQWSIKSTRRQPDAAN